MRFVMKQKVFSFGDDFIIRDEYGNELYNVDGKAFAIGDKLVFQDMAHHELLRIEQKLLAMSPTYHIYRREKKVAEVQKQLFTLFRAKFTIDIPGPRDFEAEGNFLDYEYMIRRGGEVVAQVSKKFFSWSDTYGIEISDDEEAILLLAVSVIIDLVSHDEE